MSTMLEKLGTSETRVLIRQGNKRRSIIEPAFSEELRSAFDLWQRFKAIESRLSEAKDALARRAAELSDGGSTVTFETGGMHCTITMRHEVLVPEENLPRLRRLLGRRFNDLVRTRTRHTATSSLVNEAGGEVLELLSPRRLSPQFRWGSRGDGGASGGDR